MPSRANKSADDEIIGTFVKHITQLQSTIEDAGIFDRAFIVGEDGQFDLDAIEFLQAYAYLMRAYVYARIGGLGTN